jgi:hypothetical protein
MASSANRNHDDEGWGSSQTLQRLEPMPATTAHGLPIHPSSLRMAGMKEEQDAHSFELRSSRRATSVTSSQNEGTRDGKR